MPFSATRDLWLVLKARDEGARAMKSFSRDIRMVGDSVQQANLVAARSALRNQLAMQRMTGASKADQLATMKRIESVDQEIGQMNIHRASMEESRVSAQKLSNTLGGAAATMTAVGTAMVAAGVIGAAGIKSLVDSAISYQKAAALTSTQVDGFGASMKDMEDIGIRVANKIGVSFGQIQPALFDIFSSMEVNTKQAESLLETFSKAAVAGQTDISSASRATIGIMNAFQLPLTSVNHLMDVQFQLVKEGVGTYEEWTQRIGLVSPSAVRAGQSVEMMAAALAVTTRMGISAARSGTAVSRAMDAMSNPVAVANLKALGINAQDASGHFRPMIDVLTEFRTALQKVPEKDKIATILDVFKGAGGTIEARRFLQNMLLTPGNLELFKNIFETMSTESGSFEKAYAIMADTAATKSELLANKWETLKVKAGEALIPVFLKVLGVFGKMFDWFNKLDSKTQQFIATVAAGVAVFSAIAGVILLVLGTIAGFAAAVAVAGSTLFIVLGILALVSAAFVGLTAAIVIAWNKSSQFRGMIADLGNDLKTFYQSYIIPTGQAIKDAWDKYMKPPLTALVDILEKKLFPIFRNLQSFIRGKFLEGLKEIGNVLKDMIIWSFEQLGRIIHSVVIPAIKALTEYYYKHEATIKMVVGWLVTFSKWMLKIAAIAAGVLAIVIGSVVVGAILAFIGVIVLAVIAVVKIVETIKTAIKVIGIEFPKAWNAVASFFVGIWNAIASFFVGIWNKITGVFAAAWQGIVNIFTSVMNFISTQWNVFWNSSIGQLALAVIHLVIALVNLLWTTIVFLFEWGVKAVTNAWNILWDTFVGPAINGWNAFWSWITTKWNELTALVTQTWNFITSQISEAWNNIQLLTVAVWNTLHNFVAGKLNALITAISNFTEPIRTKLASLWSDVEAGAKAVWDRIISFFNGKKDMLAQAGKNIIQSLIDGITSKINDVTAAIEHVTKIIRDHLPFSPAKLGPLSGKGSPYLAGKKISRMLADGMSDSFDMVTKASRLVASSVGTQSPSLTGLDSTGRTYNQNIVVNTQEINPRRQAAELGFLLAGGL